jgi:predicted negative regulator of RcsB-dependent stress response
VEDLTDNEREEQLRRWWSDNWRWIIGGIALGMALLWGWQYWQRSKAEAAQQAEANYQSVLDALSRRKNDEAVQIARSLREQQPASPYADQADLALARAAVEARNFDDAAQRLRAVIDGSKDTELRSIARTRLARVLTEQGKFDEAVALLDVDTAGAYAALFHDLRGDAFAGKGDGEAARREYAAALAADKDGVQVDSAYIELKRDALPVAPAAATTTP